MPYAADEVRQVTGPAIRPGDLGLTRRAVEYCGLVGGDRVLDVGCGLGTTAGDLQNRFGALSVGLDPSGEMLAGARGGHPGLLLVQGHGEGLPFASEQFGALFCECVLSLIPDPGAALGEFNRVLKRGGHLVISDLYRLKPETPSVPPARGCPGGAVSRSMLIRRIASAGFRLRVWEDHSRELKTLAARLVWTGVSIPEYWGLHCGKSQNVPPEPMGYALVVARKKENPDG
jgi:SAM-dependent methyltransferase